MPARVTAIVGTPVWLVVIVAVAIISTTVISWPRPSNVTSAVRSTIPTVCAIYAINARITPDWRPDRHCSANNSRRAQPKSDNRG
jgi:hypothetical protein